MKAFFLLLISLNSFAQCGFWVKDKTEFSEWITTDTISSSTDTDFLYDEVIRSDNFQTNINCPCGCGTPETYIQRRIGTHTGVRQYRNIYQTFKYVQEKNQYQKLSDSLYHKPPANSITNYTMARIDTTDTSRHGSVILSNSKISYIENLPAKQVYSYKGTFTTINLDSIKYKTQNFIMGDSSIIINSSSCSITSEIFNAKISNSENVHIINGYTKIRNKPIRINTTRNKIFVWTGKSYKIISI